MFKVTGILGFVVALAGCMTPKQKAVSLVKERAQQLQHLSTYESTTCDVTARPMQPALARFSQMYPGEIEKLQPEAWHFTWRQWESRCEITTDSRAGASPVIQAERGFLEAAFCLISQVFYVNSPFDELQLRSEQVSQDDKWVRMGPPGNQEIGIFLSRDDFTVVTRTSSRGEFSAQYALIDGQWLPRQMEHKPDSLLIVLDNIKYGESVGRRRVIQSLMLSVGTERPLNHSELIVDHCRRL